MVLILLNNDFDDKRQINDIFNVCVQFHFSKLCCGNNIVLII